MAVTICDCRELLQFIRYITFESMMSTVEDKFLGGNQRDFIREIRRIKLNIFMEATIQ